MCRLGFFKHMIKLLLSVVVILAPRIDEMAHNVTTNNDVVIMRATLSFISIAISNAIVTVAIITAKTLKSDFLLVLTLLLHNAKGVKYTRPIKELAVIPLTTDPYSLGIRE